MSTQKPPETVPDPEAAPEPETAPDETAAQPESPPAGPWEFIEGFPAAWHLAVIASAIAILGFFLPWATIDDHPKSLNAAGLLTYYFTAHDTWQITKTSPIGALVSVIAPLAITASTIAIIPTVAWRRQVNAAATILSITSLLFCIALLGWCTELLDPDLPRLGPFNVPQVGLIVVMLANVSVISIWGQNKFDKFLLKHIPAED